MDWIAGIQNAINYVEDHITEELDYADIAKAAACSSYNFQRIFGLLCGFSLGEYIRNRRLTLAGRELSLANAKVIDVALRYGYESPESFSRAFAKFHGITPSDAKKSGAMLKSFSRLSVQIILKGGNIMDHRVADKKQLQDMNGAKITVAGNVNKIICLWPALASSFFVLGAGDLIKGVSDNSTRAMNDWTEYFYPGAHAIPSLRFVVPEIEEILKIAPDLVIIHPWTSGSGFSQEIIDAGIPAVDLYFTDYKAMIPAYAILGKILGGVYQKKLNKWCSDIQEKTEHIRSITADIPDENRPLVYYITGQRKNLLIGEKTNSMIKDWIEIAGGHLATVDIEIENNSPEELKRIEQGVFDLDPDIILVGGPFQHILMDQIRTTDGWKDIKASKNNKVYNIPYGCFNWDRFGLECLLQIDYTFMHIQPELAKKHGINRDTLVREVIDFYEYYHGASMPEEQANNMLDGLLPDGTVELSPYKRV